MNTQIYSYYVDDEGNLKIFKEDYLLAEVSDCKNKSQVYINNLIYKIIKRNPFEKSSG